jgi:HSP20 family protein
MEFEKIINRMEELVSSSFDRSYFSHLTDAQWKPPLDVYESGDYILVVVELAGVKPEEVSVQVADGQVAVSGVRQSVSPGNQEYTCHHMEMLCGRFFRRVTLDPAVTGRAEVEYEEGLLKIKIYKEKK